MKLPIEHVPGTSPPKFVYHQIVSTFHGGPQSVRYETCVPTSLEPALCDLIAITKQLAAENARLKSGAK